ncbi:hypothetical protein S245_023612, partial [Arachis hypogaea]
LHRERIDERMKALPELVSSINKTNRNIYSHSDGAQTLMFYDVSQDEPQVKGRLPNCIAKYLEERCYKELRSEHIKFVNIVAEAFNKLISHCKVQIVEIRIVSHRLKNLISQLYSVAEYFEFSYTNDDQKQ